MRHSFELQLLNAIIDSTSDCWTEPLQIKHAVIGTQV